MRCARSGKRPVYPLALRISLAMIPFAILSILALLSGLSLSSAALAVSGLAASPTSAVVCAEPNDVAQQAQGPLSCDTTYYCLLEKSWDLDFFYIDLVAPVVLTATLTDIPPASDWDLYLYDSEIRELAYSVEAGNAAEAISQVISESGRYYIAVECYDGPRDDYPYTFSISCAAPSGDTPTPSATFTLGPPPTPTSTGTDTGTPSPTETGAASATPSATGADTATPSPTDVSTITATATGTASSTSTSGPTPTPTEPPNLDLTNAIPISCGQVAYGSTVGKTNNVTYYNCVDWEESGPEDIYVLTATVPIDLTAIVTPDDLIVDLDVFILGGPSENDCLAYGTTEAHVYSAPPGVYYIVVDGYVGFAGSYRLDVQCADYDTATPTSTPSATATFTSTPETPTQASPTSTFTTQVSTVTITPTPTATELGGCGLTLEPEEGPAETVVLVTGHCPEVTPEGQVAVYFDDTLIFNAFADALGGYQGILTVPAGATLGEHDVYARDIGRSVEIGRATFRVTGVTVTVTATPTLTPTIVPSATSTPTPSPTPFEAIVVEGLVYRGVVGPDARLAGVQVDVWVPALGLHDMRTTDQNGFYRVEYRVRGHLPGISVHAIASLAGYDSGFSIGHLTEYQANQVQVIRLDIGMWRTPTVTPTRTQLASPTPTATGPTATMTRTSTVTPTLPRTGTAAHTPTPTSTSTPQPPATGTPPNPAVILGSVQLQGRPTPPHASWSTALNIYMYSGSILTYHHRIYTDVYGQFALPEVWPGTYRILVKSPHTLAVMYGPINLRTGINLVSVGVLAEGDVFDDNIIDILDFSLLRLLYGQADRRGDLNQDGVVDALDFSLLRTNYGLRGDEP